MHERPTRIGVQILERVHAMMSSGTFGHRKPRALVVSMGFKKGQSTLSPSPGSELLETLHFAAEADVTLRESPLESGAKKRRGGVSVSTKTCEFMTMRYPAALAMWSSGTGELPLATTNICSGLKMARQAGSVERSVSADF